IGRAASVQAERVEVVLAQREAGVGVVGEMREVAAVGGVRGIGDDAVGIDALHIGELAAAVIGEIFLGNLLAYGWTRHRVLLGRGSNGRGQGKAKANMVNEALTPGDSFLLL